MKVLTKRPGFPWKVEKIEGDRCDFEGLVAGHPEAIWLTDNLVLIVNNAGKILDLAPNFEIPGDTIVGPVVLVGARDMKYTDIPEEAVQGIERHHNADNALANWLYELETKPLAEFCECDYADERNDRGYCKRKGQKCNGCGDVFMDPGENTRLRIVDRKDICKVSSRFGNYYITLTAQDVADIIAGKCLALTGEEYGIFVSYAGGR